VLRSLAAGLRAMAGSPEVQGVWVLFADTVYESEVIARLGAARRRDLTVTSVPAGEFADHPIGLVRGGDKARSLVAIGPELTPADGVMAPAVYWPREAWPEVTMASRRGLGSQWQLIRRQLAASSPVRVMAFRHGQVRDIDTRADLARIRASLLGARSFAYFRRNLSKDERTLRQADLVQGDCFLKHTASRESARREAEVLRWLGRQPGEALVPRLHGVEGRRVVMEYCPGIRLYELLRMLTELGRTDRDLAPRARATAICLLQRGVGRLARLQGALRSWPGARRGRPYPLESQVGDLLVTLADLLGLPAWGEPFRRELTDLSALWAREDAVVPYRDATPKNTIVAVPQLAPRPEVSEAGRREALRRWLADPECGVRARLVEIDFTSVVHLTAPEDDFISLLGHEGSFAWAARMRPLRLRPGAHPLEGIAALAAKHEFAAEDWRPRAARALLVRYLRFGGRKLAYRIVNPAGFAVRFRHDDPAWYFRRLPRALMAVDPSFGMRWPHLLKGLRRLAATVACMPGWRPEESGYDPYLSRLGQPVRYWAESPIGEAAGAGERP
jgi:hypothetical protein